MRLHRWQVGLAVSLIALTTLFYGLRWVLFPGEAMHNEMLRYLVDDVAFLFIQVLLVSMLLDGLIQRRAREAMLTKLNMLIGAFFSECGTDLLGRIAVADSRLAEVREDLVARTDWGPNDYEAAKRAFIAHEARIDLSACDLHGLKERLAAEKSYFLGLLGNQALLEHESFSDLLWAVTHLSEELAARESFEDMPETDAIHLAGDVRRAYALLGVEWIEYLRHLQSQYPYLFSLALRTNPLDPEAEPTVRG